MTQLGLTWQDYVSSDVSRRVRACVGACRNVWAREAYSGMRGAGQNSSKTLPARHVRARGMLDGDRSGVAK